MKRIDKFILHDLCKAFKKCDVAFYIEDRRPYNSVLPSIRMRCHDILMYLEQEGMKIELYKPYKKYKVVIFTKVREFKAVKIAEKLHSEGTIVISDNFCEGLTNEADSESKERQIALGLLKVSDYAFVYSKEQYGQFSRYHDKVMLLEESVHDDYFKVQKKHIKDKPVTLIYSGFSSRAMYVKMIADKIKSLQQEYGCKMLFLCEKDPEISEFDYEFEKYNQDTIAQQLIKGDIMIAPRDRESGGVAHTLSKVAMPMAVGLPAVASPVPSYLDTPVLICRDSEEWYETLKRLIVDFEYREQMGKESRDYIERNYSRKVIGKQYKDFLEQFI